MEMHLHHVQVSGPAGCEEAMRAFYGGVLGMAEVEKPEALRARGGAWFRAGSAELHIGIEEGFAPARKAHPGIAVADVAQLAEAVAAAGAPVTWDENIPGLR
ncbi:MAG: glyoxalase, partial [Dermatophilaceae bacterium]|nr:glyoxalase [Dermatophilaceae bacterium]